MQASKLYINHAADHVERALNHMPPITIGELRQLPCSRQEITRYVEQLLTPTEQSACDMATD